MCNSGHQIFSKDLHQIRFSSPATEVNPGSRAPSCEVYPHPNRLYLQDGDGSLLIFWQCQVSSEDQSPCLLEGMTFRPVLSFLGVRIRTGEVRVPTLSSSLSIWWGEGCVRRPVMVPWVDPGSSPRCVVQREVLMTPWPVLLRRGVSPEAPPRTLGDLTPSRWDSKPLWHWSVL